MSFKQRRFLLKTFIESQSFTIHQKNIAIELFKVKRNLSNVIMCNIFETRTMIYNLRSQTNFVRDCINTQCYGLNSQSYFALKVWDMVPSEINNVNSLQKFKTEIPERPLEIVLVIFVGHTYKISYFLFWFKFLIYVKFRCLFIF